MGHLPFLVGGRKETARLLGPWNVVTATLRQVGCPGSANSSTGRRLFEFYFLGEALNSHKKDPVEPQLKLTLDIGPSRHCQTSTFLVGSGSCSMKLQSKDER